MAMGDMTRGITVLRIIHGILHTGIVLTAGVGVASIWDGHLLGITTVIGDLHTAGAGEEAAGAADIMAVTTAVATVAIGDTIIITASRIIVTNTDALQVHVQVDATLQEPVRQARAQAFQVQAEACHHALHRATEVLPCAVAVAIQDAVLH